MDQNFDVWVQVFDVGGLVSEDFNGEFQDEPVFNFLLLLEFLFRKDPLIFN